MRKDATLLGGRREPSLRREPWLRLSQRISTDADELVGSRLQRGDIQGPGIVSISAPKQMQIKIQINVFFPPRRKRAALRVSAR